jgi:hypothetical protein
MVPNKSLLDDLMKKAKAIKGLAATQWTAANQDVGKATLIFVALESLTSYSFKV